MWNVSSRKCPLVRGNHSTHPSYSCGTELPEASGDLALRCPPRRTSPPLSGARNGLCYPLQQLGRDNIINHLRQARNLSVVEIRLTGHREDPRFLEEREVWKAGLIDVLKNSPSKDRKFLRWNLVQIYRRLADNRLIHEVVEAEVLEVLPESSL